MLILFDLDDTLLDHSTAMRSAAQILWHGLDTNLTFDQFFAVWVRAHEHHYPRYLSGELTYQGQRRARIRDSIRQETDDVTADGLFNVYFSRYEQEWSLFSDAVECLNSLSRHQLGVITNGQSNEQRSKLARTGIIDAFSYVLVSDECGFAKPAAAVFHRACADLGVRPGETVYVGDRYDLDAGAARRAGLRGVWLDRRQMRNGDHLPPIICSLRELPALVEAIEAGNG